MTAQQKKQGTLSKFVGVKGPPEQKTVDCESISVFSALCALLFIQKKCSSTLCLSHV
jgi:hypothetical protein